MATTIVTSNLLSELGKRFGLKVHETLTGFKWIADVIRREEGRGRFVVGGEESYGYMIGDAVRDKDAVAASCLLAEMAHVAHAAGTDLLGGIGSHSPRAWPVSRGVGLSTRVKDAPEKQDIAAQMESFRAAPPRELAGEEVLELRDYQEGKCTVFPSEKMEGHCPAIIECHPICDVKQGPS